MWPSNSPDINPVDYAVWGVLQEIVYCYGRFTSVEPLKNAIITVWGKLSQHFINRAINEWRAADWSVSSKNEEDIPNIVCKLITVISTVLCD